MKALTIALAVAIALLSFGGGLKVYADWQTESRCNQMRGKPYESDADMNWFRANCIKGNAQASSASGASAYGTVNPKCGDRELRVDVSTYLPPNCRVHSGDLKINNTQDPNTWKLRLAGDGIGNITICNSGCYVAVVQGGGITGQTVESIARDMSQTGCRGGCPQIRLCDYLTCDPLWPSAQLAAKAGPAGNRPQTTNARPGNQPTTAGAGTCPGEGNLTKGVPATMPAGCIVAADVSVNGVKLYEGKGPNEKRGLIVTCMTPCQVTADFGNTTYFRPTPGQSLQDLAKKMTDQEGCGSRCDSVKICVGNDCSTYQRGAATTVASTTNSGPNTGNSLPQPTGARDSRCTTERELKTMWETAEVSAGCTVLGKVEYRNGTGEWKEAFDSSEGTMPAVYFTVTTQVRLRYPTAKITSELPQSLVQKGCGEKCTVVIRPSIGSYLPGEGLTNYMEPHVNGNGQNQILSSWCKDGGSGSCFVFPPREHEIGTCNERTMRRGEQWGSEGGAGTMPSRCVYWGKVRINNEPVYQWSPDHLVVVWCPYGCIAVAEEDGVHSSPRSWRVIKEELAKTSGKPVKVEAR